MQELNFMNPEQLLDQLSTHLKNTIATAISSASAHDHPSVTPVHLLLALLEEKGSIGCEIVTKLGISHEYVSTAVASLQPIREQAATTTKSIPELDAKAKQILEKSMLLAYEQGSNHVGTEHLLYGLISVGDENITHILNKFDLCVEEVKEHIATIVDNTAQFPEMEDIGTMMNNLQDMVGQQPPAPQANEPKKKRRMRKQKAKASAVELFTVNLTSKAQQKRIDPVVGREEEIDRVITILARRTKNNPILVGEPGVGKTAIVEGLAKRINEGDVPRALQKKKILSLDLTLLISGTIYRGEFEGRLKQIIDEVAADPNYILFIDEIHNIIGAGSNQGTMDAANILKPALARGQLRCIGATTIDEYKKHITSDPALERRFQSVTVDEPNFDEAVTILSGVKKFYEHFHHVAIDDDAITTAVELSTKYVHDYFLPDKAIDLIDEAAAAVKIKQKPTASQKKLDNLHDELQKCQAQKEDAILAEAFDQAMEIKKHEAELEKKIAKLMKNDTEPVPPSAHVSANDVAAVLGKRLHIDPAVLLQSTWQQLDALPETLRNHIVGQDHVIDTLAQTLRKAHLGLKDARKPLASMLFAGPSGVGKTALAIRLAKSLFHDEKALIRFDMSEFAEQHGVSKLLGSPAGYVGHKDRNRFTDEIKKRPYAVLLLDEIDKAHPDVVKLLLQILDTGELTDSNGKKIHFNHAVVVMTTNIGEEFYGKKSFGFGSETSDAKTGLAQAQHANITKMIQQTLGKPLTGRIDATCLFAPLQNKAIEQIVSKHIGELSSRVASANNITITADEFAVSELAKSSYDKDTGVRNVEQITEQLMADLLSDLFQKKRRKKNYTLTREKDRYKLV